jgi:uncharacterized protein with NRDE domain
MCTFIVGRNVLGSATVVFGANRDEDPMRPSDPPGVLQGTPRLVGGRDRVAGGTWLALRPEGVAVAMLNRRPLDDGAPPPTRSRGLLALETAGVSADAGHLSDAALRMAKDQVLSERFAPFSMLFLSPAICWILSWDGLARPDAVAVPELRKIRSGWHVVTHADMDDTREPRTARLHSELEAWVPESEEAALARLRVVLSLHGLTASGEPAPAVCLHEGRMQTVSYALGAFASGRTVYLHGEGRPCEVEPVSQAALLSTAAA